MERQFHEVANIFPLMQGEEFDALKADIAANGLREPVWLHADGRIIDGRNRYRACCELGMEPDYRTWNGAGSLVAFVVSLNLHRRHLTESQRAMIAAKLANMPHGGAFLSANLQIEKTSQSQAADMLKVSTRSVSNARVVYTNGEPDLVDAVERGDVAVSAAAKVATLPAEWQRVIVTNGDVNEAAKDIRNGRTPDAVSTPSPLSVQLTPAKPHVAHNSGNNEWYTPVEYLDAARAVMGGIDLDPASSDTANTIVNAERYYTAERDGLSQHWTGRVWLNPPYSSDLIGKFAEKLAYHYRAGDVPESVVLVNNATETAWFATLAGCTTAVVFPRGRVRFWQPDGALGAPLQGQAVLYFGPNADLFLSEFKPFGWGAAL